MPLFRIVKYAGLFVLSAAELLFVAQGTHADIFLEFVMEIVDI